VEVELRSLEFGTLLSRAESSRRDFDALIMSSQPDFRIDESPVFHSRHREEGPYAWSGIADPELDLLLDSLAVTGDPAGSRHLWAQYQDRVRDLQPYTWLYFPDWLTGVRSRLQGVSVDPRGEWTAIRDWWIPGEDRR
jgi:peptide/nickel transport system substrate-binding protein